MESDQSFSRIDTLEIKTLIYRRIGHQRAEKYSVLLQRLFTLKINKSEFDKLCIKIMGMENIRLHNRLIRSLIKNASTGKSPPPRSIRKLGNNIKRVNGYHKTHLQSLCGDPTFPPSPCKGRSRKFRDRPSPLGPLGKPQSITNYESVSKEQSATELFSLASRPPVEVASVEEGEEVEQVSGSPSVQSKSPVTVPFGVSINFGVGARKSISDLSKSNSLYRETCQNHGELPDTRTLRSRIERKLEMEGLGVSMDSVNVLNDGLDSYLKRLIEPCLGFSRSHCHFGQSGRSMHRAEQSFHISMLDFHTAMELNPRILGEDWPIQFEKIHSRASEEQDLLS